jgi:ERCC4-type nuclease
MDTITMHLTIDDRERDVSQFLKESSEYTMQIQRQVIGDFSIWKDNVPIYIIERKTWKDLSSSICDGRYENHKSLVLFREKFPSCRIAYIIEGSASQYNKTNRYGVPLINLENYLSTIEYKSNCSIWYSQNLQGTANLLIEKMKQLKNLPIVCLRVVEETGCETQGANILNEDLMNKNSLDSMAMTAFTCIPSIGKTTAKNIVESGISLKMAFQGLSIEQLVEKMQISPTKANSLKNVMNTFFTSRVDEHFIASCKGISMGLATKISRTFTYQQLFDSPQNLALKMSSSSVVSKRLYSLLIFQKSDGETEDTNVSPPVTTSTSAASSEEEVASNVN